MALVNAFYHLMFALFQLVMERAVGAYGNTVEFPMLVRRKPAKRTLRRPAGDPLEPRFQVEPEGRDVYITPLSKGQQLLLERRAEFEAASAEHDDIIMEYPDTQKVAVPPENDDTE